MTGVTPRSHFSSVRQRLFVSLCCGTPVVAITLAAAASPQDAEANSISLGRNNTVVVLVVTAVGTRRISDDVPDG
jgi:hypothetical protein